MQVMDLKPLPDGSEQRHGQASPKMLAELLQPPQDQQLALGVGVLQLMGVDLEAQRLDQ